MSLFQASKKPNEEEEEKEEYEDFLTKKVNGSERLNVIWQKIATRLNCKP